MIRYVQGDLLASNLEVIAHGCNCHGVMGSGIAAQIRAKWPNVYEVYNLKHRIMGLELGTILPVRTIDGRMVINCMTQDNFGRTGAQFVSYEAVENCIAAINASAENWGATEIGMPKIGAGLGGGDWDRIEDIIVRNAKSFLPVVYTL
jgi:O-acetyl-ADP-ribose deacetylase (regulator of RNase III)